jgi:hypothetical protein
MIRNFKIHRKLDSSGFLYNYENLDKTMMGKYDYEINHKLMTEIALRPKEMYKLSTIKEIKYDDWLSEQETNKRKILDKIVDEDFGEIHN